MTRRAALGHFLDQPGNQQVIDALLARGVRITDAHPPSPKLREGLDLATLLSDLGIPRLTPLRARQLADAVPDAARLLAADRHNMVIAGLPNNRGCVCSLAFRSCERAAAGGRVGEQGELCAMPAVAAAAVPLEA